MRPLFSRIKFLALGGVVVLAAAAVTLVMFQRANNPSATFASYAELESAGMFERGWLPRYLPKSARDIVERHNLDTNAVWASFHYTPGDSESVQAVCRLVAESPVARKYLCPSFASRTTTIVLRADGSARYESHDSPM